MRFNSETDNPKFKLDEAGNVQDGFFFFFFNFMSRGWKGQVGEVGDQLS